MNDEQRKRKFVLSVALVMFLGVFALWLGWRLQDGFRGRSVADDNFLVQTLQEQNAVLQKSLERFAAQATTSPTTTATGL